MDMGEHLPHKSICVRSPGWVSVRCSTVFGNGTKCCFACVQALQSYCGLSLFIDRPSTSCLSTKAFSESMPICPKQRCQISQSCATFVVVKVCCFIVAPFVLMTM